MPRDFSHLHEVGESFPVVTFEGEGVLFGVYPCVDQKAVDEVILSQIRDQIVHAEAVIDDEANEILEMIEIASSTDDVTLTKIKFEEATGYKFDVYPQRLWSATTPMDMLKEATDETEATERGTEG